MPEKTCNRPICYIHVISRTDSLIPGFSEDTSPGVFGMDTKFTGKTDNVELALLLGGITLVVLAYFLPAVTFAGQRGAAAHGLSIFSKLPLMSAIAFIAMSAAVATRFVPAWEKYVLQASVIAILLVLAPALIGFMMALDPWTGLRQTMLKMANARTVKVDPSVAYIPLFAGATMMSFALRRRLRRSGELTAIA